MAQELKTHTPLRQHATRAPMTMKNFSVVRRHPSEWVDGE